MHSQFFNAKPDIPAQIIHNLWITEIEIMLKPKIKNALTDQINKEFYSAYLYLSMSSYFQSIQLKGASSWMKVQAKEEVEHAMKICAFIEDRLDVFELDSIDKPITAWDSPLEAFEDAFKHEQSITASINNILKSAREEGDYATESFLKWFVDEQVEEEAQVDEIIQKIKLAKESPTGLLFLDFELSKRQ